MNISSINLVAFDNRFIETIKDYKKIHLKEGEGTYYTITANKKKAGVQKKHLAFVKSLAGDNNA